MLQLIIELGQDILYRQTDCTFTEQKVKIEKKIFHRKRW